MGETLPSKARPLGGLACLNVRSRLSAPTVGPAGHIELFNEKCKREIFVPKTTQQEYVKFTPGSGGSQCNPGRKSGIQILAHIREQGSVWHEMGHCVGLAHEQYSLFRIRCPLLAARAVFRQGEIAGFAPKYSTQSKMMY